MSSISNVVEFQPKATNASTSNRFSNYANDGASNRHRLFASSAPKAKVVDFKSSFFNKQAAQIQQIEKDINAYLAQGDTQSIHIFLKQFEQSLNPAILNLLRETYHTLAQQTRTPSLKREFLSKSLSCAHQLDILNVKEPSKEVLAEAIRAKQIGLTAQHYDADAIKNIERAAENKVKVMGATQTTAPVYSPGN